MSQNELNEILRRLDRLSEDVAFLTARQRAQQEMFAEFTPIVKEAMNTAVKKLDAAEKSGVFEFGNALVGVAQRITEGFNAEDVNRLGDAVVNILETVRSLTQPEILQIAGEASSAMTDSEDIKPIGMFGMVRATKDEDVQKGMALMVEVLRRVGRGVNELAKQQEKATDRKAKLAKALGPKRTQKRLGIERPTTPKRAEAAPACATPKPPEAGAVIDGVAYSSDGHLMDASVWTRELGLALAQMQGLTLTDEHWKVLDAARADFATTKQSPNIRRLTTIANISTKEIYALFPKPPGRTIAKVAGLPKPAGCL